MEQIVIIHEDGTTLPLFSKRNASTVSKAAQKAALLNEDVVTITVQTATPLQLYIGDKVVVFGKRYRLNQLPEVTKDGERKYTYELKLEGAQYELLDIKYHLPETCYGDNYYSDLYGHLQILMWNINRVRPAEWVLGEYPENTEFKNINTDGKNCLAALQTLCSDYNVEFEIAYTENVTTLNVKKKVGRTLPLTLQFGRGRGLYQLQRKNVNNAGIINRLFVYGGTGNLPQEYPHTKLCLSGTSRLTSYIEDKESIKKYGVKEGEKNYSEVEPEYKGKVTAVGKDLNTFTDSEMFDLNQKKDNGDTEWLIDGTPAKIKFQSGGLAGYEFDIHSYDHETRTFVINPFKDENGDVFPSAGAFQIEKGNEYIITEIRLPTSYITNAQKKLEEKGREDFATLVQPQVSYGLSISDSFMVAMFGREADTEVLRVGDSIPIVDEGVGVDKEVRITQLERNLLKPHSYTITLSDTVTRSTTLRVLSEIENINEVININNLADPAKARRRWLAAQELLGMVFDTEGQYYSEKIKPLSIETAMLSVGAKSQQFVLSNVLMEANANGDPNSFTASNGFLTHYAMENDIVTWNLVGVSLTKLADNGMYIYAKCSKTTNEGTYHLTNEALKADADAAFYYFLIGTLSSAIADADGKRVARILSLTYGATTINGRFISTGRIQSANGGKAYFDLDNAEIGGKIKFVSADGSYKDVADVEQQTADTKDYIDNTLPSILKDIDTQIDGKIETWFQNTDPSTNWETDAVRAAHVGDLWFNTDTKNAYCYSAKYSWDVIENADAKKALEDASNAQDTADGKRRVFTDTPTVPYDKGDLWVQGAAGGILVANASRTKEEKYTASDWVKASNYTGDENLNEFIDSIYTPAINNILKQLDGVVETWFGSGTPSLTNTPANDWATDADKEVHLGDIYYNNEDGAAYRFSKEGSIYKWVEISDSAIATAMQAAAAAQDTADGKRRVFVTQPVPPYDVGDLWANGTFLKVCLTARGKNATFISSDWDNATNYTGDEALEEFVSGVFKDTIDGINEQLDGKIECWYSAADPSSSWSTFDEKNAHVGDQWYNTSARRLYRYTYTRQNGFVWEEITNQTAIDAAAAAAAAQDTADGKRRVFVTQPTTPYDVGDLWTDGNDLYRCNNARATGSYVASDWGKATNYTDDSALNDFIEGTYSYDLETLQNQIDGKIESWFQSTDPANNWTTTELKAKHEGDTWFDSTKNALKFYQYRNTSLFRPLLGVSQFIWKKTYAPTLTNAPASSWTTDSVKNAHIGDLYYNSTTRKVYQFKSRTENETTVWYWDEITDVNTAYVAEAAIRQFADGARCWNNTKPTTPYNINDIYITGYSIYTCTTARSSGSYTSTDWKYSFYYVHCWQATQDQTAIDAYIAASQAQDTADGKRRVFLTSEEHPTPQPPYEIGDLWVTGSRDGSIDGGLKKCVYTRLTGSYYANDWAVATCYDNTKTTIDGGIVTSGTVQLAGDDKSIKAGITGEGTADTSVRMWAGASKENKATAPFRVTQDGKMVASNADITGKVNATSGTFKGRVEAQEGVFYGSIATPPVELEDNLTPVTLDFSKGFNFTGTISGGADKVKVINLPMSDEYIGVQCSIINYGGSSNGYYHIRAADTSYPLLYSGKLANRNNVTHLKLYGCAEVRLKAIKVMGVVRWFVQNPLEFSFDYQKSCFTNGISSPLARCIGSYWLDAQQTLRRVSCADNNPVKISSYTKAKWSFAFTKSRPANKSYSVIIRNNAILPIITPQITKQDSSGFTVVLQIEGFFTAYHETGGWGFEIYEFDV